MFIFQLPQEDSSDRPGVIGWISQGIVKVVPQPEAKYTQNIDEPDETTEISEVDEAECKAETCIHNIDELPDAEPLPHIPVVEMVSEDEASAEEPSAQFQPKVVEWIKTGFQNALPHHVPRPPDYPDNSSQRSSRSSNKVLSPPPESVTSLTEVDTNVSVMGWIVHGLGLALPQPVLRSKEDHGKVPEVIQNGGRPLRAP
ncbi:cyclic nucleotide-gated cation channel beta-1-like [Astyanax mexicanus]|uniref:cyclic nucleotide-gated cation channel beta-1-like n=1 Tax=Astyanax mexicanus TaxID=7994 RepID=UPI0020CB2CE5|nr:cyclic nucleotide-gated cation channel beta-1-like [Astyanax mexicanus]